LSRPDQGQAMYDTQMAPIGIPDREKESTSIMGRNGKTYNSTSSRTNPK
jgi:hypothetical protein